ncbi:hypothetical protein WJX77_005906 [Trebouxia sp. C0004]
MGALDNTKRSYERQVFHAHALPRGPLIAADDRGEVGGYIFDFLRLLQTAACEMDMWGLAAIKAFVSLTSCYAKATQIQPTWAQQIGV